MLQVLDAPAKETLPRVQIRTPIGWEVFVLRGRTRVGVDAANAEPLPPLDDVVRIGKRLSKLLPLTGGHQVRQPVAEGVVAHLAAIVPPTPTSRCHPAIALRDLLRIQMACYLAVVTRMFELVRDL